VSESVAVFNPFERGYPESAPSTRRRRRRWQATVEPSREPPGRTFTWKLAMANFSELPGPSAAQPGPCRAVAREAPQPAVRMKVGRGQLFRSPGPSAAHHRARALVRGRGPHPQRRTQLGRGEALLQPNGLMPPNFNSEPTMANIHRRDVSGEDFSRPTPRADEPEAARVRIHIKVGHGQLFGCAVGQVHASCHILAGWALRAAGPPARQERATLRMFVELSRSRSPVLHVNVGHGQLLNEPGGAVPFRRNLVL